MASIKKRPDGRWRARYRDEAGKEHAGHFRRKVDAQNWLDDRTAAIVTGQYVDPKAGKETFKAYAERWRKSQVHRPQTATRIEKDLRTHIYPAIGDRALSSVRTSEIQALVKGMSATLQASTVRTVYKSLRTVFAAAVTDRLIVASPCTRIALPSTARKELIIPDLATLRAVAAALPRCYGAVVWVAAGLGLRPGEIFGLRVEDVDFLRREVRVRRQLDLSGNLVELKTAASYRTVPLPDSVGAELSAHLARVGRQSGLMFTGPDGRAAKRKTFDYQWTSARKTAGAPRLRLHDLRHAYASALIDGGESVKTVQTRVGHASAMVTLDVYGHLWPDSDERTRSAVEAFLSGAATADSVRTSGAS